MRLVGIAHDDGPLLAHDARLTVPARPDRLSLVKFNRLAVIDICTECPLNHVNVALERVRANLHSVRQPLGQIGHERNSMGPRALADAMGRDQLSIGVEGNEGPYVADAGTVILRSDLALLLAHVAPNLVRLYALTR